jgi:hypothetical protein
MTMSRQLHWPTATRVANVAANPVAISFGES